MWSSLKRVREQYAEQFGDELLFLDPPEMFDACIAGVAERCAFGPAVVYYTAKVLDALVASGLDEESAQEHFEFNILGAYVGEHTPLFLSGVDDAHAQD